MTLTFENEQDFDLGFDPEEVAAAVINGVLDQEACPYEAEVELILTLVAHSMLHLLGYDHMTPEEAAVMEAKQEEVLQRLGITRD